MKIAFITYYPESELKSHHGRWYYIADTLKKLGHEVIFIDDLNTFYQSIFKLKSFYYKKILKKNFFRLLDKSVLRNIAATAANKLSSYDNIDLIFAPGTIEIAYLKTDIPIVVWTDTTFHGLNKFYNSYKNLPKSNIRDAIAMDTIAHNKCSYVIYPSKWAAKSALDNYNIGKSKIKIINFGSTLESPLNDLDIKSMIKSKSLMPLKLLFAGIEWQRKGGDVVIEAFNQISLQLPDAELHIAGIPPNNIPDGKNIFKYGFLKKNNEQDFIKLTELFSTSHFFFVPSRAETYGMVFAEAGSYGMPVITSNRGGITAVVRSGINGFTFDYDNIVNKSVRTILKYYTDKEKYRILSEKSYNEFKNRLNWNRAGKELQKILDKI